MRVWFGSSLPSRPKYRHRNVYAVTSKTIWQSAGDFRRNPVSVSLPPIPSRSLSLSALLLSLLLLLQRLTSAFPIRLAYPSTHTRAHTHTRTSQSLLDSRVGGAGVTSEAHFEIHTLIGSPDLYHRCYRIFSFPGNLGTLTPLSTLSPTWNTSTSTSLSTSLAPSTVCLSFYRRYFQPYRGFIRYRLACHGNLTEEGGPDTLHITDPTETIFRNPHRGLGQRLWNPTTS